MTKDVLMAEPKRKMEWHDRGLCNQVDPDLFYPEVGSTGIGAKRVCVVCPVRETCLEWAMEHDEEWGVWGGYTPRERQAIRKGKRVVSLERVEAFIRKSDAKRAKFRK